jgi:hypothetical protein
VNRCFKLTPVSIIQATKPPRDCPLLCLTKSTFVFRAGSFMYRIISNRAPHLVSNIRTLHLTPNGTSKLLRRVDAPASTRLCSDVYRQYFGHATFFSSRQMTQSHGESKQLAQPALFRHMAWTLTGMQALIPTAILVADGCVAIRWSENRV